MKRAVFTSTDNLPARTYSMDVSWQTWSDLCDFIPTDKFIRGTYIDKNNMEMEDGMTAERMGVVVLGSNGKEVIISQGVRLYVRGNKILYFNRSTRQLEEI